ncbi:MAG: hypothetical protein GY791_18685 [Alphaproteobacteria bacterium]|nr:hypothetical protein [Alphaproteobacteria bacterium]
MNRRNILIVIIGLAVGAALAVWLFDDWYVDRRATETLDQLFAELPPGYTVTYDDAEASAISGELTVTKLRIDVDLAEFVAAYGAEIGELAADDPEAAKALSEMEDMVLSVSADTWLISDVDLDHNPPLFMTQEVQGFTFDFADFLPGEERAAMETLFGDTAVRGNLRLRYSADPESGEVDIPYYEIDMDNIGALEFSAKFGGYFVWPNPDQPFAAMANLDTLTIGHLTFTYDDHAFFDRVLRLVAAENGLTVDEVREQAVMMIGLSAADIPDTRLQMAGVALAEFVKSPGRLTLKLAPAAPVNLMELSDLAEIDPVAALDKINFSLTKE